MVTYGGMARKPVTIPVVCYCYGLCRHSVCHSFSRLCVYRQLMIYIFLFVHLCVCKLLCAFCVCRSLCVSVDLVYVLLV